MTESDIRLAIMQYTDIVNSRSLVKENQSVARQPMRAGFDRLSVQILQIAPDFNVNAYTRGLGCKKLSWLQRIADGLIPDGLRQAEN
jgi:hypothetical protein